ncbi:MAG: nucleotidyl transferase AbiEii/AbiGii toxin family protein [Proteobacteria bacterium]|nr:nucleotidyl transferase AbiEii/AbiGii toxin family protein [Pseudomonadota bacterium]
MSTNDRAHMRAVIEKELLHYDILFTLDTNGLLDKLTFQGGTSLRLCYGSPRFSEDLDFAGGKDFSTAYLMDMKNCIEHYIGTRYGLEVTVKEPQEMSLEPDYQDIKISKWQIRVTVSPERKDIPKQKIKIEVANIPAYSREPKLLLQNYDFLPDGYSDTLIMVESLNEIMADKLISLVDSQKYVRNRDIWDLHWLKQRNTSINSEYLLSKIADYKITDYTEKLNIMLKRLSEIIHGKNFHEELSRFIPVDVQERTLLKNNFLDLLTNEISSMLSEVKNIVVTG